MEYATFDQVKTLVEMQGNIANGKLDSIRQDVCRVEGKVDDLKVSMQTQGADLEICNAEMDDRVKALEGPAHEKATRKKLVSSWKTALIVFEGFAVTVLEIIIAVKVLF
jgi:hypothetical protein